MPACVCLRVCACVCVCMRVCYTRRELLRSGVSAGDMHFVCRKFLGTGVSSEGQCFYR